MKKLIISAITAAALLFGFASCSGDLHDVDNSPYKETDSVYLIGGLYSASVDSSQYISKSDFLKEGGYEVRVTNGELSFEFTYTGEDKWSAGAGNQAFTIASNVDNGWTGIATRWGNAKVAVGETGSISLSDSNIVLTGLEAGTKYTLKISLLSAAGSVSVEKGLSGVSMDIINVKDSLMKDAVSATAKGSGEKYIYTYTVAAATAGEMNFVLRLGKDVWIPSAKADLAEGKVTITSATRFDEVKKIEYPLTFKYDAWEYGYELTFTYDTENGSLEAEAVKLSGMYIASNISGGAWAAMTPVKDSDGTVLAWTIEGTGAQLNPGWGPIYGINTARAYNDDTYRALKDGSSKIEAFDVPVSMSKKSDSGDESKNVEISAVMDADKKYLLTFTAPKDNKKLASIKLSEVK